MKSLLKLSFFVGIRVLSAQPLSFGSSRVPVDPMPYVVRTGDFNKDGVADIAVLCTNSIDILLGNGDGTFKTPAKTAVGVYTDIQVADLNHDGYADVIAVKGGFQVNSGGAVPPQPIDIFLGKGDGTFAPPVTYNVPYIYTDYAQIVVADANGDGKLDVIGVGFVLPGNGDGTFGTPVVSTLSSSASMWSDSFAVADFNGDGKADFLFSLTHNVDGTSFPAFLALGQASGMFSSPLQVTTSSQPFPVVLAGDFDGDGKWDALVSDTFVDSNGAYQYQVRSFGGRGDGTFKPPVPTTVDAILAVAAGDLNGDGKADFVAFLSGSAAVRVYLSKSDGTFQAGGDFAVGTQFFSFPQSLALADLNGDGLLDIIVPNGGSSDLSILINAFGKGPAITSATNASDFGGFSSLAPGTWVEIKGTNLAASTRSWLASDFSGNNAPTSLDNVQVNVGSQGAFLAYISPGQVNVQLPSNIASGDVQLTVTSAGKTSAPFHITVAPTQPGLLAPASFKIGGNQYVVAILTDGNYVLPAGAIPGVNSRPARPGETMIVYGIGFGPVIPDISAGQVVTLSNQLAAPLQFLFGNTSVQPSYAGLAPNYLGLYQFNVKAPSVADNDVVPFSFTLNGAPGTQTLYTAVHQ
jgi:uncharacterized protein (TIGR03437 family)